MYSIFLILFEPKDFHLWEQWLGSGLQPLPAVFPLRPTFQSFYIAISYFRVFKRFSLWSKPPGLEPRTRSIPTSDAYQLHQTSNLCCHQFAVVRTVLNWLVLWQHTSIWLCTHYSNISRRFPLPIQLKLINNFYMFFS